MSVHVCVWEGGHMYFGQLNFEEKMIHHRQPKPKYIASHWEFTIVLTNFRVSMENENQQDIINY